MGCARGSIYIRNNNAPITDPLGTAHFNSLIREGILEVDAWPSKYERTQ